MVHTLGGNVAVEMMDVLAGIETAGTVQDLVNTSTQMRFKISQLLLDCINIQQHCVIICTLHTTNGVYLDRQKEIFLFRQSVCKER